MTPSNLLQLAKIKLITPDNVHVCKQGHHFCICDAIEAVEDHYSDTAKELGYRINKEISRLAPGYTYYPTALAASMGIEYPDYRWKQKVRHDFVDRLIAEYEAVGR